MPPIAIDAPTQVFEKSAEGYLPSVFDGYVETVGSPHTNHVSVTISPAALPLPVTFLQGLEDCEQGRTVDMEHALTQLPCGCGDAL